MLLALGANLPSLWGNPAETLSHALETLSKRVGVVAEISRFYATPAVPAGAGPDFVNAALSLDSDLIPRQLLDICHSVEAEARRTRDQRWGPRTLDIDFLACGPVVLPDAATQRMWRTLPQDEHLHKTPNELILPHPRLQDRAFVLVPLADVAPDWVHPALDMTVAQMLARLPRAQRDAVKPLKRT